MGKGPGPHALTPASLAPPLELVEPLELEPLELDPLERPSLHRKDTDGDGEADWILTYRDGEKVGESSYAGNMIPVTSGDAYIGAYQGSQHFWH